MDDSKDIPNYIEALLRILQIFGRLLLLSCLLLFGLILYYSPLNPSTEHSDLLFDIACYSIISNLPLGILLVLSTRKLKGEKKYGVNTLKIFERAVMGIGLSLVLLLLWMVVLGALREHQSWNDFFDTHRTAALIMLLTGIVLVALGKVLGKIRKASDGR